MGATAAQARQRLLYPNPAVGIEAEDVPADGMRVDQGESRVFVSQPLVIGDRRRTARRLGRAETDVDVQAVRVLLHELQARIRSTYVELAYLAAHERLLTAWIAEVEARQRLAGERADAGAAPPSEAQRIMVEYELLVQERERVVQRQAAGRARLEALLGVNALPHERLKPALVEPDALPAVDNARNLLLSRHPELHRHRLAIAAAETRETHERSLRVPDPEIGIAYSRNHAHDENLVQLGISIPMPAFDRRQGHIAAARSEVEANRSAASAVERELLAELKSVTVRLAGRRHALKRYDQHLLPEVRASYERTVDRYRAGKASLLDLLDATRIRAQAEQDRLAALYQLNLAWTGLQTLTQAPVTLPRNHGGDAP